MIPPIRFSSTIRVVSSYEFDQRFNAWDLEMADQNAGAGDQWTYKQRVRQKPEGITTGVQNCNAGGFQNGDSVTLFHLEPTDLYNDDQKLHETLEILEKDIREMKQQNPEMRALLAGGDANEEESTVLKESLLFLFAKFGIPTSIIWGGNNDAKIHYDTNTDTWTLSTEQMGEPTLDEFRELFPEIRIDAGDELLLGDEEIDPEDVNS